jgi:hypothetical protein
MVALAASSLSRGPGKKPEILTKKTGRIVAALKGAEHQMSSEKTKYQY